MKVGLDQGHRGQKCGETSQAQDDQDLKSARENVQPCRCSNDGAGTGSMLHGVRA
jgi:hypothetical protein